MSEAQAATAVARRSVWCGSTADTLSGISQRGVELALWRCGLDSVLCHDASGGPLGLATLHAWLTTVPEAQLPVYQLDLQPAEAEARLKAACDASSRPGGEQAAAAIAQPGLHVVGSQQLAPFGVALFKCCGRTESDHDTGIVHRSLRISGMGLTRLLPVLDPPHNFHGESRP